MELVSLYPYDPTARATSNKIVNESITVIPPSQITDYSYVVPRAAPFFAETLVVKDGKGVGARTLVENVDYWCVIDFLSASVGLTKRVSVGIALLDPNYSGTLYVSYQTLGGNYTMADYSVLEELIRERYVVKHVSYEQIINLPAGFSPEWHKHEVADMVGMSSVVTSLNNIKVATESRNGSYGQIEQQLRNHVNSASAHTPADIGLGNVKNYGVATLTDAKGGSVSKYITADILKQYVAFEKNDVSGFLSKSDAALTYQTIANMSNYYDKATSDGRYAYKSDTYTKGQVDALVSGIDVSDSLGGYYTKSQSDARYAAKSDLDNYSTTSVADGRYATKLSLNSYYTKVDADGKYALKTQSYTKGESDGRYLGSTALNGYLTQSVADSKYLQSSALNNYYTKTQSDNNYPTKSQFNTLANTTLPQAIFDFKNMRFERNPGTKEPQLRLEYNQNNEAVTYFAPLSFLNDALGGASKSVEATMFIRNMQYRNYTLSITWRMWRVGGMVYATYECSDKFYYDEPIVLQFSTGPAPGTTSSGRTNTGLTVNWWQSAITKSSVVDYWFRLYENVKVDVVSGEISLGVSVSTAQGSSSTLYSDGGFRGGLAIALSSEVIDTPLAKWFLSGSAYIPKHMR